MISKRAFAILFVAMIATVASAQEFGRVSGGEIELHSKGPKTFSGTLGFSMGDGARGYEASLGGTILEDRLWFFAAGYQQNTRLNSSFSGLQLPDRAVTGAIDAKLMGQIGDKHNFSASFNAGKQPFATTADPLAITGVVPSSFLSLRYTGIVSSNMFFNASFSRHTVKQPALSFAPGGLSQ